MKRKRLSVAQIIRKLQAHDAGEDGSFGGAQPIVVKPTARLRLFRSGWVKGRSARLQLQADGSSLAQDTDDSTDALLDGSRSISCRFPFVTERSGRLPSCAFVRLFALLGKSVRCLG